MSFQIQITVLAEHSNKIASPDVHSVSVITLGYGVSRQRTQK